MKKHNVWCLLLFFCATSFGQNSMSSSGSHSDAYFAIGNFVDCAQSTAHCPHLTTMLANKVFAHNYFNGVGEGVTVIDTNNHLNVYSGIPSNTLTLHNEYGTVYEVEFDKSGTAYGIVPDGSCSGGNGSFDKYVSGAWSKIFVCVKVFSIAEDGGPFFAFIGGAGHLFTSTDSGAHHTDLGAGYLWVSAYSSTTSSYYSVKTDHTIWYTASGVSTQITGASANQIDVDGSGVVYILDTNGAIEHYNGTGWDVITSSGQTFLANGGSMNVWTVGTTVSGADVYFFADQGLEWDRTYSGNVQCGQNVPPALCATFSHTASIQLSMGHFTGSVVNATPWNGSGQWGITGRVRANDIWGCLVNGGDPSDCAQIENQGAMHCSGGGSNNDTGLPPGWAIELATSRGLVTSTSIKADSDGNYTFKIRTDCTLNPPDLFVGNLDTPDTVKYNDHGATYFDVHTLCGNPLGLHQPFICLKPPNWGFGSIVAYSDDVPVYPLQCTYNP